MLTVTANGVAFKAMSAVVRQATEKETQTKEAIDSISNTKTLQYQNQIIFTDPKTNQSVKIELTLENMTKLKNSFKTSDFHEQNDGSIRLSGIAEAFVAGWYGDIAYNRDFLKADADSDGKLSDEEYKNTKNGFIGTGTDRFAVNMQEKELWLQSSDEVITKSYISPAEEKTKKGTVRYNDNYKPTTIQDELNTTLRIDKDLDGEITLSEAYKANANNEGKSDKQIVVKHDEEYYNVSINMSTGQIRDDFLHSGFNEIVGNVLSGKKHKKKQNDEDDAILAQKAMQKLIAANGNESVLNAEEKQAIQMEIKTVKKQIKDKTGNARILDVNG